MTIDRYAVLARVGPLVTTGEAAAALRVSTSQASRTLRALEASKLGRRLRRGLWLIGTESVDPRALVEAVTHPNPAYVSFASALSAHGMIDQIPREITVASLDAAKKVSTAVATYAIHHLPPELFDGWEERGTFKLARPEKAIFDLAYVSAVHFGRPRRLPELDLPPGFDRGALEQWTTRIRSPRIRTLTSRGVRQILSRAVR